MLVLLTVAMAYNLGAQEASQGNFSLQQAIDFAMKNSPNYLNSELDQRSAEYRKNEITGQGLPQITGSIDLKDYLSLPTSLIPGAFIGQAGFVPLKFGTQFNATAGFSASWNVLNSDYFFGLNAAKEYINLSHISVTRSKADLVSQVSKAYYGVVINKQRIKLLDVNIARTKSIYDQTKAMNQQGFVELIDVERLEVQYNNLMTEKEKTERLIALSENVLKFQMGFKISDPITLSDSLNLSGTEETSLSSGPVDITQRPDYKLLKSQQALYDLDVKRLKWGYMPSLSLYGSYQYNKQRNEFKDYFKSNGGDVTNQWFKIALIGGTINLNIFDGLQRHNRIQQAKMTAQKNQNNLHNLELAADLEVATANVNYSNAYATMLTQKKNMELASHVYDVTQKKYKSGVGPNIEVTNAEAALRDAQNNYFNSVYDMYVARIDYQKAAGTLVK